VEGLDGEIGIDGAGAVSDEQGEVHDLAGSPLSMMSATWVRVFSRTRRLWTAAMASRLGMGA